MLRSIEENYSSSLITFIRYLIYITVGRINNQDKRAVETMILSGMDKEALYAIFPTFSHEAIDEVYESVKAVTETDRVPTEIKCNCS